MPSFPSSPSSKVTRGAERSPRSATAGQNSPSKQPFWKLLPHVWELIKPRRWILALGFALMLVSRVSGLVAPYSLKFLFDNVIGKHQSHLLPRIVLAVVGATILQGITSYSLTQLLSKSSQRMITELRVEVQAHIGRLPVSFYDANKTGVLVSRIMNDVEGVRNLIGTGLVDFVGGIVTAILALGVLLRVSVSMTAAASVAVLIFGLGLNKAFKTIRPMYRARPKLNAEGAGRLTESLGGVRVVKGYHAEEREEKVFQGGVQKLLDNVLQTLTATSLMSLSAATLTGLISAVIMYLGAHRVATGAMTPGSFVAYNAFLLMLIVPVGQIVSLGPQMTEALAGLERTHEILSEKTEEADPSRTVEMSRIDGRVLFEGVGFAYETGKPVLYDVDFTSEPGTVTAF